MLITVFGDEPNFFSLLGVRPVIGRTLTPEEDQKGAGPVALISERLWKRKFGSALDVLGKSIALDGRGYTVVGVIPASFDLLLKAFSVKDVYVPIIQWDNPLLTNRSSGLIACRREGQFVYSQAAPEALPPYTRALAKIAGGKKAARRR